MTIKAEVNAILAELRLILSQVQMLPDGDFVDRLVERSEVLGVRLSQLKELL
jgi:hypothetical protein